ncbi:FAD-dependent oxidoreductase [Legionella cardiaca]|uniref:D-amino-acid oxidase n=1 Tax=Legionella cardiaca TaxID=1071983 RepID=A0ABY8AUB5_9GAMM|nr:FAD-dependent oxidoreductase [Legionella cardiaca]WED43766.1 FAD-dependent oxidoreductase [Legionella cardiaca]
MEAGIAGSGIMGNLLALALYNAGWQVTLFEQEAEGTNCSAAAAGLLTPISELDRADWLIARLGLESITVHWPTILQQLPDPIYFRQAGSIVVSHPHDKAEWVHFSRRITSRQLQNNIYFQQLSGGDLTALEPELNKFENAYYFADEAQIDSQLLLPTLKRYLEAQGVRYVMNTKVLSIAANLIITHCEQREFDMVFDCRGLGAACVFNDLRALRGELIWLHAPDVQLQRPIRLLHPRYSLYIVPRPGNIYLIGASEIEAEDYSAISLRTTLELLTAAYYVHAGFAEARILKTVTHCRPTFSTHLPRIRYSEGLIAINGLYRHGYLIAPTLAKEVLRGLGNRQNSHYPEIWENEDDKHLS